MAVQNSPIRNKGVGKDSKRHDLDGTPGLSGSDLQYGDIQKMEAGQRAVQNTRQMASGGGSAAPQPPQGGSAPLSAPDPLSFAKQKLGRGQAAVPTQQFNNIDLGPWMPLAEKIATSKGASPMLKMAYLRMLDELNRQPIQPVAPQIVDVQALDRAVEEAF